MSDKLAGLLYKALGVELEASGFKFEKKNKRYVRTVDDRTEIFWVIILSPQRLNRVRPSIGIRFEEVEQIFHRTSGDRPEFHKGTSTVGISLDNVYGVEDYQIPLRDEADVKPAVSRLMAILREKAQPYFAQFSTLEAVDVAINDKPREESVHGGLPINRCSRGLIVAKLTGRKNYDELVSIYREIMQKDNKGFYLPKFEDLISDLAKLTEEGLCNLLRKIGRGMLQRD